MNDILDTISNGEGLTVEFKKSRTQVTSDVYQSICTFLNRNGGQVFLGVIDPASFTPFPKNPVIARVFKEMGRADELGSGVKNLFRFTKDYSGASPQLIEDDIFRIIIPLTEQVTEQVTEQINRHHKIIEFCRTPRSTTEILGQTPLTITMT